jgi:hypothetical protein
VTALAETSAFHPLRSLANRESFDRGADMRWLTKAVVRRAAISSFKATMVLAVFCFVVLFTPLPKWFGEPIKPTSLQEKISEAAFFLIFMAGILFCVGLIPSATQDDNQ